MPLGVTQTEGEGRVRPETSEAYHKFCRRAFGAVSRNLLSMTDGAEAYRCRCAECRVWFLEHHYVNHSRWPMPELTRSQPVLDRAGSQDTRNGWHDDPRC